MSGSQQSKRQIISGNAELWGYGGYSPPPLFFYKNIHLRNGLDIKLLSLRMNVISHYNYVLNVRLCDNDSIKFSQH